MGRYSAVMRSTAVVALGAALLAMSAGDAAAQRAERAERGQSIDTTFAFAGDGDIEIRMPHLGAGSADVSVIAWPRNEVRIVGETDRGELTIEASGRRLEVGTRSGGMMARVDRLALQVPAGSRVRINNGNGDVEVRGITGGVDVTSYNGDIELTGLGERIRAKTYNGDLAIVDSRGHVEVSATNGDLELRNVGGELDVKTLNGDIELAGIAARIVHAKTMSGTISYDGAIEADGEYTLSAFSGGVDLIIPRNSGATLTVSTFSGTIDSPDFPLTLRPGTRARESKGQSMTFTLGNGGARISLESFSGEIRIRERTADRGGN